MKRRLCLGFVVLVFLAGMADADPTLKIDRNASYSSGYGGEFTILAGGLLNSEYAVAQQTRDVTTAYITESGSFQSFCVEYFEGVVTPGTYFYTVDTYAIKGGVENPPTSPVGQDPIDLETAYLYTQFAKGTLSGFDYTASGRVASAAALQNAIWYLEDEIAATSLNSQAQGFVTTAQTAVSLGQWQTIGSVRVLNLYDADGVVQSQLYVPVPGAVVMGLLGLGYAGMKLRKRV